MNQDEIKQQIIYDKNTGKCKWKTKRQGRKIEVGTITPFGYKRVRINGKNYPLHHLIWLYEYGYIPKCIDHINHNKLDNRICNLREVEHIDNMKNRIVFKSNTSGKTGVSWSKRDKVWRVYIGINGKYTYIGSYKELNEAIKVRKEAEIKHSYHENHGKEIT